MTIVRLVCTAGCAVMLVAALGYMGVAALRRPQAASGLTRDPDAEGQSRATGAGLGVPVS
jgi:hypothetical protein